MPQTTQDDPNLRRGIPGLLRTQAELRGLTCSFHMSRLLGVENTTVARWWSGKTVPNIRDCAFLAVELALPRSEVERARQESLAMAQAS